MKVTFYFDWFPGMNLDYAQANVRPFDSRVEGGKRFKFEVELPDPYKPDEVVATTGVET